MDKNVTVPESMISMLFGDVTALHGMLARMISMYALESELKKHHKAYLHVRDEADELCQIYSCALSAMKKRWDAVLLQEFGRNALKNAPEKKEQSGVLMSNESFENIMDDTLCLTECIDVLSDNLESIVKAVALPETVKSQYINITNSARAVADDVLERWMNMGDADGE